MSSFLPNFLWSQLLVTPQVPRTSFEGRRIIVTGGNAGLGLEAARLLLQLEAKTVILAVRSAEKGAKAKHELELSTQCHPEAVQVWELDMASVDSVQKFAAQVSDATPPIDGVILNAGIQPSEHVLICGDESTLFVNVISTFLLAVLLLPVLTKTARQLSKPTHLTIVGSDTHMFATFPERHAPAGHMLDELNKRRADSSSSVYATSKLLQIFCMRALTERAPADLGVIINVANPGLCHSNMTKYDDWRTWLMINIFARRPELGARAIVAGACADRETHGQYIHDGRVLPPAKMVVDGDGPALREAVWKEVCAKLEKLVPGVTDDVKA